ncbi:LmeA family phospholipid-binding protein [Streptomyces griseoflavus]|uniref:LmeA family phospholipid-binding protein n=1 Tax=Streptomyces griseoflavus TaxID=35619 RepID=UPI003D715184
MRALRILLIVVVILGGIFVIVDRVAVNFAEGEAADRLKANENLASTPDVSIEGFPFLTQVAGGTLDEVRVGIEGYEAGTGDGGEKIRIGDLRADMKGVDFSSDFSSAVADSATGTATVAYDELLKKAKSESTQVAPGVTAEVVGLSDGGNGKIKVAVEATVLGTKLPEPVSVLSSVTVVDGNTVRVKADALPEFGGVALAESRVRRITDFEQRIDGLPGGIRLDKVEAGRGGVDIVVKGSDVRLVG